MEDAAQVDQWVKIVIAALGALVSYFLVPFLKRRAEAAEAARKMMEAQEVGENIKSRGILVKRLQEFLYGSAAAIAEKKFPLLAETIQTKGLDKSAIKKELRSWGGDLKQDAQVYFDKQGLDITAAIGDEFLDKLIERAANAVSPFPGRDTAKALLQEKVTDMVIDKGVEFVRKKFLSGNE